MDEAEQVVKIFRDVFTFAKDDIVNADITEYKNFLDYDFIT